MRSQTSTMIVAGALLLILGAGMVPVAVAATLPRDLRVGDFGDDVLLLQQILNRDAHTRVAAAGAGSPGNETRTFGAMTKAAVIRFQEKYASEVLVPAGLTRGTGFVGSLTRKKLLGMSVSQATGPRPTSTAGVVPRPTSSVPTSTAAAGSNPNLVNLEAFIAEVARVQREHRVSEPLIATITNQIRTDAMTKGDFKVEFARREAEAAKAKARLRQQTNQRLRDILIASLKEVNPFKGTAVAHAAGTSFGGPIVYVYTCTCSDSSILYIGPPSTVSTLDYVNGTQEYLAFNLPYASLILGLYTPGIGGTCYITTGNSCSLVESSGVITGVVGSSPD